MKSRFLFSHKYKPLGWVLFIVGSLIGVFVLFDSNHLPVWEVNVFPLFGDGSFMGNGNPSFTWSKNDIVDEIAALLIVIGGILVAFSKTEDEDEFISKIRMESLIWATYVNYIVLLIAVLFVFDMAFFNVMIVNMFTILVFFIVRFHYVLYKSKKGVLNEE